MSVIEEVPGEMEAAIRKVQIKKASNIEEAKKLLNLNAVSASCPILNLKKNDYHELYLKANQVGHYHLQNKERI